MSKIHSLLHNRVVNLSFISSAANPLVFAYMKQTQYYDTTIVVENDPTGGKFPKGLWFRNLRVLVPAETA